MDYGYQIERYQSSGDFSPSAGFLILLGVIGFYAWKQMKPERKAKVKHYAKRGYHHAKRHGRAARASYRAYRASLSEA